MARYHIKRDGTPGICRAKPGNCPYGKDSPHFESIEATQSFSDLKINIDSGNLDYLTEDKIYSLNDQEAQSIRNSLGDRINSIDSNISEVNNKIVDILDSSEYIKYKEEELRLIDKKSEIESSIKSNEIQANIESSNLYHEARKAYIDNLKPHEFKEGKYTVKITINEYLDKPVYIGFVNDEEGHKEPTFLTKFPQDVVQKAFKSQANKDAFKDLRKFKDKFDLDNNLRDNAYSKKRREAYPPVNAMKEKDRLDEELARVNQEVESTKDNRWGDKLNVLGNEQAELTEEKRKYTDTMRDLNKAQETRSIFYSKDILYTENDAGQWPDDEMPQVAKDNGFEQGIRQIWYEQFTAHMTDAPGKMEGELKDIAKKWNPLLKQYNLYFDTYGSGEIKEIED